MSKMRKSIRLFGYVFAVVAILIGYGIIQGNVSAMSAAVDKYEFTAENTTLTYDAENNAGSTLVSVPFIYDAVFVGNQNVLKVRTEEPLEFDREGEINPLEPVNTDWDVNRCEIIPMAVGITDVIFKGTDASNNEVTYTATVTVTPEYFASYLKRIDEYLGIYYQEPDEHGEPYARYKQKLKYGFTTGAAYGRYGIKVSIKLGGKTRTATCNTKNVAKFTKLKAPLKMGTKGTLTYEFGEAKVKKTFTIGNGTEIQRYNIKANAKKGKVAAFYVHKGDIIKVKIGKKTLRTYKVKKNATKKTVTFKSKKKLKKNTKVKYYVYNKYKQKLTSATYKVGTDVYWDEH